MKDKLEKRGCWGDYFQNMIILFCNIRGLGKAARRRQLKDLICTEGVDTVGPQETFKKDF